MTKISTTVFVLIVLMVVLSGYGYFSNMYQLFLLDFAQPYKAEVFRIFRRNIRIRKPIRRIKGERDLKITKNI